MSEIQRLMKLDSNS